MYCRGVSGEGDFVGELCCRMLDQLPVEYSRARWRTRRSGTSDSASSGVTAACAMLIRPASTLCPTCGLRPRGTRP